MCKLFSYIFDPFKIIKENKIEFFIWFVFTILAGQLGILANIIIRYFYQSVSIEKSIYLDSIAGNFYTYAIAVAASALGPLFATFIKNKKLEFSSLKVVSIIIVIFYLIFSGIIYAAVQMKSLSIQDDLLTMDLNLDTPQLFIYVVSIFIGLYTYCLLKISPPDYSHLDDNYAENDDKSVAELAQESKKYNNDGTGVAL